MEIRQTSGYIWIGTSIDFLKRVNTFTKIYGPGYVIINIDQFLDSVKTYEFFVTETLASPMRVLGERWKKELSDRVLAGEEVLEWEKNRKLTEAEVLELNLIATPVRDALMAEASLKKAYILHSNRYQVDQLLDDVESLMPDGVFESMPYIASSDFRQASRALAFELPTASAFHILRATEDVLREFYEEIVRRNRITSRMWGPITTHLSEISKPIPKELLGQLDHVRNSFRNPTQHPEKIYDMDEAHELFSLCIGLIHRMQKYLDKRNGISS